MSRSDGFGIGKGSTVAVVIRQLSRGLIGLCPLEQGAGTIEIIYQGINGCGLVLVVIGLGKAEE